VEDELIEAQNKKDEPDQLRNTVIGTPYYLAPKVIFRDVDN